MTSFNNIDDSAYHQYSGEIQALYVEMLNCGRDFELADSVHQCIKEKVIDAMLDWDLSRSDLNALGRLLNLCENRESPPEDEPEIQYLPK